jgi:hypothetical protein
MVKEIKRFYSKGFDGSTDCELSTPLKIESTSFPVFPDKKYIKKG